MPRIETATFPATGMSVAEARRWLGKILDGHLRRDDAVLLLSEAATNSLVHTGSTAIRVAVTIEENGDVRVEVADEGGTTIPSLPAHHDDALNSSGRGVRLIQALSTRWGFTEDHPRHVLWFVLADHHPAT
ncbi:ATP-binding protein [Sphaerisporangium rhizosphaerae]|uniref:ATP-binding protein n=1 Tax=Sphaerisporangium rhizosphaerae TaxID=2269375 RepID=A0ABW2PFQ0_9ACTN